MVGAIGEILGAAGVIATLGYLARQIRLSRRQDQRRAGQAAMDQILDFLKLMSGGDGSGMIWVQGLFDIDALAPPEQARFASLALHITYLWERIHYLGAEGAIDPDLVRDDEPRESRNRFGPRVPNLVRRSRALAQRWHTKRHRSRHAGWHGSL